MKELDKYIEEQVERLAILGITDSPDEEYLKQICEGYYKIKHNSQSIIPVGENETIIPNLVGLCPSCGEEISRNGVFNSHRCKK